MVPPAPQNPRGYEKAVSHLFEGIVSMLSCKKVKKLRLKEVCNKQRDEEKRKIFRILYIREGLKEKKEEKEEEKGEKEEEKGEKEQKEQKVKKEQK